MELEVAGSYVRTRRGGFQQIVIQTKTVFVVWVMERYFLFVWSLKKVRNWKCLKSQMGLHFPYQTHIKKSAKMTIFLVRLLKTFFGVRKKVVNRARNCRKGT